MGYTWNEIALRCLIGLVLLGWLAIAASFVIGGH